MLEKRGGLEMRSVRIEEQVREGVLCRLGTE